MIAPVLSRRPLDPGPEVQPSTQPAQLVFVTRDAYERSPFSNHALA